MTPGNREISARDWFRLQISPELKYLDDYWSEQITAGGPIPQEALGDSEKLYMFRRRQIDYGIWVGSMQLKCFHFANDEALDGREVHLLGIGTGDDLREVTIHTNQRRGKVVAWDIASAGCKNGQLVFRELIREGLGSGENLVCQGEAEDILKPQYLHRARYIVLARFLETLDRPSHDDRKMYRVCLLLGQLMRLFPDLELLIIGARPEYNHGVTFKNTKPVELRKITAPIHDGAGRHIRTTRLDGGIDNLFKLFRHRYSAHRVS